MSNHFLASRLNRPILFLTPVDSGTAPDGSPIDPRWEPYAEDWAEVLSIGGEEGRLAAADSMQVRYRITVRYRDDIDPSMRIGLYGGKALEIKSMRDPDDRGIMLEINALEQQGAI